MLNNLQNSSTEDLITYISCLRSLNISLDQNIISCMRELLNRNIDLKTFDLKDQEISFLIKNIKNGYIVTFSEKEKVELFLKEKAINYLIINKESLFINENIENDLFLSKKPISQLL
jgi:hypothetical protein